MRLALLTVALLFAGAYSAAAQDPTKVDPKHYKVIFEDANYRMIRIAFGPKEKGVMHAHPPACYYNVTGFTTKETAPDGKVTEGNGKAGDAGCGAAFSHLNENLSDKPFEMIIFEPKPGKQP